MRVLVVIEDDPGMRMLIREILTDDDRLQIGGETSTFEGALTEAKKNPPDVLIIDHYIEGDVMGLEAAPRLKDVVPAAKIILFSSHDLKVEASREPAVDVFLPKKHLTRLLPTIQELLGLV